MHLKRILVPIDGSPLSLQAAEQAGELAQRFSADLTLFTAVEPPVAMQGFISDTALQELREALVAAAGAVLDAAAAPLRSRGITVDKQVEWNTPATAISAAAQTGYDLIVMGSHGVGLHPVDRNVLGSVTERVLRRVGCPVLVIPGRPET